MKWNNRGDITMEFQYRNNCINHFLKQQAAVLVKV